MQMKKIAVRLAAIASRLEAISNRNKEARKLDKI